MIRRVLFLLAAGATLSACQPAVPDSGYGVGFDETIEEQQRARDAALEGSTGAGMPAPVSVNAEPLASLDDGSPEATAAETARVLAATRQGQGAAPVTASPSNPPPVAVSASGISDENNFDAVSGQRTISDDAARIAANRAQYQIVQPKALPTRVETGPNVVAYALSTQNERGVQVYNRSGFNKARKYERSCGQYGHPDQAQIAFLAAGGPEKDPEGMDPDGDGFACTWDPTPFRRAARG